MTKGLKIALAATAAFVLAIGVEVIYVQHRKTSAKNAPVVNKNAYEPPALTDDQAVFLRKERPDSVADERQLVGKTIWVSAGGQMEYYKDAGKHADYAHPVGMLLGAEPLIVRDVFEQKAPANSSAVFRIAAGQRQVLLAFTMPKSDNPKQLYAVPVGNYDEGHYNLLTDEIFFYDDPHVLYKHWGPEVWAHVDKHEAVPGMTENQAMMALGQVITPHGDEVGNRSVTFNNNGHPLVIDFKDNKAVKITPGE